MFLQNIFIEIVILENYNNTLFIYINMYLPLDILHIIQDTGWIIDIKRSVYSLILTYGLG